LDNTLWGGVIGDDGLDGIRLGDDWPGNPYKAFQRAVLGLRDRGIVLAVASKNDEAVAAEVFRRHPEMLIKWNDLAAVRINWKPKSVNLRSIADELNIGVDSLVLFDDNPVERAEVRAGIPTVGVVEVPADPVHYRRALMESGYFDQVGLSAEDFDRADMYRTDRARRDLEHTAQSVEEFLRNLEMEAVVAPATDATLGRIAQLIGKTNQFNLTTRRHKPADLSRMMETDQFFVAGLRLRDRFGDQGLIAVAILERKGDSGWLDTFLMSCRVMNRGVERAMLAYLAEQARVMGCNRLIGEYRPTDRNRMVEGLLPEVGFIRDGENGGGILWRLDLAEGSLPWPGHIRRLSETLDETHGS
jgi:FkbH-like protein